VAKSHHHNTKTNKTQHTQAAALRSDGTGRQVFFGLLPDVWIQRTQMPVGLTIPSTRHGETTDVPLGDGDSDRDAAHSRSGWLSSRSLTTASTRLHCRPMVPVPRSSRGPSGSRQPRSGCLSSRSRRQRRYVSNAGRLSRFRFVPATDRHSLLLLPTTATSLSADVPWLPSRPASQRSTLRFHGNSALEPQFPTASGGSTHDANLHYASIRLCAISLSANCRALTQFHFARLFHTAAVHCRIHVRSLARSTVNCRLSRNVFASPLKHVLFT